MALSARVWGPESRGSGPPEAYSRSPALAWNIAIVLEGLPGAARRVHGENVPNPGAR